MQQISLAWLLGLLFIGLKLGGVINWSWFWVLTPFWFGPLFFLSIMFLLFLIALLVGVFTK